MELTSLGMWKDNTFVLKILQVVSVGVIVQSACRVLRLHNKYEATDSLANKRTTVQYLSNTLQHIIAETNRPWICTYHLQQQMITANPQPEAVRLMFE